MDCKHKHAGKSSEALVDNSLILKELNIQTGQYILDAGCGDGYMSKEFSWLIGDSGKVYAIDTDAESIATLKKETSNSNIVPINSDVTKDIPVDSNSIDLIYLSTVLHGFSKTQISDFLSEANRLLKPNGILAILEINKKDTPFGPPMNIRFSPEELDQITNMSSVKTVSIGNYFYLKTFIKTS